jgi:hypothetical protein
MMELIRAFDSFVRMHPCKKKALCQSSKSDCLAHMLRAPRFTDPSFFCDRFHFIKAFDQYKTKARVQVGWRRQIYEPAEASPRMTKRHPIDRHLPLMHRQYKKKYVKMYTNVFVQLNKRMIQFLLLNFRLRALCHLFGARV